MNNENDQIAKYCRLHLNLDEDTLDAEGYYASLPLSIIDTIFSIRVRYDSTERTVK